MHRDQIAIDSLHSNTSGEAQNEMRIRAQVVCDNARYKCRGSFFIRLYDDFHRAGVNHECARMNTKK